jgi:hypothetical protein
MLPSDQLLEARDASPRDFERKATKRNAGDKVRLHGAQSERLRELL